MHAPNFDIAAAHKFFSADCFNKAWDLIEKPDRSADECEQMLLVTHASLWHWTQRDDCTPKHLSIGYWQLSRVQALLGRADESRRYAQLSLDHSHGLEPFFIAYSYEALARAELVANDLGKSGEYLAEAHRHAEEVKDEAGKRLLSADLQELAERISGPL